MRPCPRGRPPTPVHRRGKRKSSAKPPPKKARPKLALLFDCPFCGHEKTCDVKIDRDRSFGMIKCSICGAKHSTNTHKLTQPVDVYAQWIDECDAVNNAGEAEEEHFELPHVGQGNDEDDGYEHEQHDQVDRDWREGEDEYGAGDEEDE
mmetsp:Transcript_9076/g.23483  ORF Transcript_9076/g.23483 Transcript_9076/m.23483 type:complete len:149 (-) Transcript_9076:59-505(-)